MVADNYNNNNNNNNKDGRNDEEQGDNLEEMLQKYDKMFEEIIKKSSLKNLDFSGTDCKRRMRTGFQTSNQVASDCNPSAIKIGSLEADQSEEEETMKSPNIALLNYFATLGSPGNTDDLDIKFVDVLCENGDVDVKDAHGQSLLHEVAREWSPDVAHFLCIKGLDINSQDNWGRTPLFVAVASNYPEMITWLINNGANLNHRTIKGEEQTPIHYAAKFDAIDAFQVLVKFGANPLDRDCLGKTPLFLAAEAGNKNICEFLLDMELPVASYAKTGESILVQMIENLPVELARRGLDQVIDRTDHGTMSKVRMYLSCLGKRRWRLLNQLIDEHDELNILPPPFPLDVIIRKKELNLINHPAFLELIKIKADMYGNKFSRIDIFLHLVFTILWTCCASFRVNEFGEKDYGPPTTNQMLTVVIFAIAAQLLTIAYIYKLRCEYKVLAHIEERERRRIYNEYQRLKPLCHPRWTMDTINTKKRREMAGMIQPQFWQCEGIWNEIVCLTASCLYFILTITWYIAEMYLDSEIVQVIRDVRTIFSVIFVMLVFLRLNRAFQIFQSLGPFINMISEAFIAGLQIFFLFFEFFVPFSVAFWVSFGGTLIQESEEYQTFQMMLYQLYLLSIVGDYEYDPLKDTHPLMAQILLSLYFLSVSIITINIYIALLSEAFARVNEIASEKAYLAQAIFIQNIELLNPEYDRDYEVYLNNYCSPKEMTAEEFMSMYKLSDDNPRAILKEIYRESAVLVQAARTISADVVNTKQVLEGLMEKLSTIKSLHGDRKVKAITERVTGIFVQHNRPTVRLLTLIDRLVLHLIQSAKQIPNTVTRLVEEKDVFSK